MPLQQERRDEMIKLRRPSLMERLDGIGGVKKVGANAYVFLEVLDKKSVELGFVQTFDMTNSEILHYTGFAESTFHDVRNRCKQLGLIDFKTKGRGKPGCEYQLDNKLFPCPEEERELLRNLENLLRKSKNLLENFPENFSENFAPYINKGLNELMEGAGARKERNSWKDIQDAWKQVFNSEMLFNDVQKINVFLDQEGMDESLILEAIVRTQKADRKTFSYLQSILFDWARNDVHNMSELITYEKENQPKHEERPKTRTQKNLQVLEEYKRKHGIGEVTS